MSTTLTRGPGTRQYNIAAGVRIAVGSASSAATALPALGESRELRLMASTRCFVNFGTGSVSASVAATSMPLAADSPEVVRVPESATHFAVIRDTADGFLSLHPVV